MTGPPGAQPERTRLAWRRTTLSCAVAAALAVRSVLARDAGPAAYAAAALGVLSWLVMLRLAHRRIRALSEGAPAGDGRPLLAVALCTLAMTAFGVVLLWTAHP
ncbi:MAG TPA: DUF202 domain-containing protein [Streptomyces sp.]|jgi:hypothetical protein|nr:DUF202 domain-containing protein [Streptomyces sp.]